jgi:septum formation protein
MPNPPLILASGSPYRQQLLRQLGLNFRALAPEVDERPIQGELPEQTAKRLAEAKALAVLSQYPEALVIGSDQVADLEGRALGKPLSVEAAFSQLTACKGKTVAFHTALTLASRSTCETEVVTTLVRFRKLSEQQIRAYIKKEAALDCAGSFKCEGLGISLFESINSSDPTALIGLPLICLTSLLQRHGISPLTA